MSMKKNQMVIFNDFKIPQYSEKVKISHIQIFKQIHAQDVNMSHYIVNEQTGHHLSDILQGLITHCIFSLKSNNKMLKLSNLPYRNPFILFNLINHNKNFVIT